LLLAAVLSLDRPQLARHTGIMFSFAKSQVADLNARSEEAFYVRLDRYLSVEAPGYTADVKTLVSDARSFGLLSERELAMYVLHTVVTDESPIHGLRCKPKGLDETVPQFRLRFDREMRAWMKFGGFDPI
jgi:hypothetical protein